MPSASAIEQVWIFSLVIYLVVVVVVALLLTVILLTARQIKAGAAAIWTVGQKVANNTIQIPLLVRTNHLASQILESAAATVTAVDTVRRHAEGCPACPACVVGHPHRGA